MDKYLEPIKRWPAASWRWFNRNCNHMLVLALAFGFAAVISEEGTTWTLFSLMYFFLWLLARVIRISLAEALGGLFKNLGDEMKKYPDDSTR